MKFKSHIFTGLLAGAVALSMSGCTDDFEEVNTNPNKVYEVQLGDVWSGTVQRSMNLISELNYNRLLNFSRAVTVQYSTKASQELGDSWFKQFYVGIMRDLVKIEREMDDNPDLAPRLGIVKTWKAYCFYLMASCYGPIPMSDAISDGSENKRYYAYDSEKEVYAQILNDLAEAYELLGTETFTVALENDPVFGAGGIGQADVDKWRRFANSLRLNVAMHVQNLDEDLARTNAAEAMKGDLFTSNADNVVLRYGTKAENSSSYYYDRFIYNQTSFSQGQYPALTEWLYIYYKTFNDPRLEAMFLKSNEKSPTPTNQMYVYTDTITRAHACGSDKNKKDTYCDKNRAHRKDGLNKFRRDSITYEITSPYVPLGEMHGLPTGWQWAVNPNDPNGTRLSDPLMRYQGQYNPSFIKDEYVGESCSLTILSYADVCFLKAEASLKFNIDGNAQSYYEEGIRAAMERVGVTDYAGYLTQDGVKWGTSKIGFHDSRMLHQAKIEGANGVEGHLEQVYKQRWLADVMCPLEQWNMERRTRVFDWPPFFMSNATSDVEGVNGTYNYWTERLVYPDAEHIKNAAACAEGVAKMQAVSPFIRGERGGDNVFTTLGFAKRIPGIETADQTWGSAHEMNARLEFWHHQWGATYEDLVKSVKEYTGKTNETAALGQMKFKILNWKQYDLPGMPEPDEN